MALKEFIASIDDMSAVELLIAHELLSQVIRHGSIKKRIVAIKKESVVGLPLNGTVYYDYYITYADTNQKMHNRATMTEEGARYLAEAYGLPIVEPTT